MMTNDKEKDKEKVYEYDEQLEELRAESRKELAHMTSRSGIILIVFSIILATVFMWLFYLSPRRPVDMLVVVIAIISSVGMFAWGLKRFLVS